MTGWRAGHVIGFAGPSLAGPSLAGLRRGAIDWRPPAATGDLLHLANDPPATVLLIDGVFGSRSAVWHKEILVLLARGFHVIGAASMGALRAAELAPFGMVGAGAIYRGYADGRITGDDEVAVCHAPAALGSAPLSLAQVDVRATLVAAVRHRVLSPESARRFRAASRAIFYADRSWPVAVAAAAAAGVDVAAFSGWLPEGAVEQKRRDAHDGIAVALAASQSPPGPRPMPPTTIFMERLATWAGVAP